MRGYLLNVAAPCKTLWLLQKLCTTAWKNKKKKAVKRGTKAFGGGQTWRAEKLAMGEGRYLKGEHMVIVWCTGTQCEGQGKKKSGGQDKRKKGREDKKKKNDLSGKKSSKKKNEKSHQHGRHGNRPSSPLKTDLRVSV